MARKPLAIRKRDAASREACFGFRVDRKTKGLIERAAQLEGRTVTEFCVTVLAQTARRTIERHEMLVLSASDRNAFFDVLMTTPASERLGRAFATTRRRVGH